MEDAPHPALAISETRTLPRAGSAVFFISYRQRYLPHELVHGQHLNLVSTEAAALQVLSFTLAIWMSAHRVLPAALTPSSSSRLWTSSPTSKAPVDRLWGLPSGMQALSAWGSPQRAQKVSSQVGAPEEGSCS